MLMVSIMINKKQYGLVPKPCTANFLPN